MLHLKAEIFVHRFGDCKPGDAFAILSLSVLLGRQGLPR